MPRGSIPKRSGRRLPPQVVFDVTASPPLGSTGGPTPDIFVLPGTNVGDLLRWNGTNWVNFPSSATAATPATEMERGAGGEAIAAWFAPTGAVATIGLLRGLNTSNLVVANTTNIVAVSLSGGNVVGIGCDSAQAPSAAVVLVKPSNEVQLDPNNTGRFMVGGATQGTWTSAAFTFDNPITLTSQTVSASATAGGAAALPATPDGYWNVSINGTPAKVPFYLT